MQEGGFGLHKGTADEIRFTNPRGKIISKNGESRFRGNVIDLVAQNRDAGLRITPRTGECLWDGVAINDGLAVEGL